MRISSGRIRRVAYVSHPRHYWLGVFFVLAHLAAGARAVILAHGVSKAFADRFMVGSAVVAGIVATVIMLGMCGMRVQFI